MTTDWKPDFTQAEPWAGMPDDYAGVATFIPTKEVPEPPWEDEIGAEVIPAYGTPQYALVAKEIIDVWYDDAQATTGAEQQRNIELLGYAKNAAEAGAGIASAKIGFTPAMVPLPPAVPPALPAAPLAIPTGLMWAGLGLLAIMVLMPKKK